MPISEDIQWLYDQMSQKGYNVGKDVEEFDSVMRANDESRQWVYNKATAEGLRVGKDVGEFNRKLGFVSQPDSTNIVGVTPPYTIGAAPQPPYTIGAPMNPAGNQSSQPPVAEAKQPYAAAEEPTPAGNGYQPSEAEIARFRNKVDDAVAEVGEESQTTKNLKEYYGQVKPGERSPVVKGTPAYNPETGEMVDRYLTDSGAAFEDKDTAGAMRSINVSQRTVQSEANRIYDVWAKEHPNATAQEKEVAQKEAYARQQWYERMRYIDSEIERLERLAQEQDKIAYPETGGKAKGLFYRTKDEIAQRDNPERREAAAKAGGYRRAIDKLREAKERYERGEQNVDSHWLMDYTRGFGSGLKEMVKNPFGLTSMLEAGEMAYLKDKIEKGAELSDSEDAYLDAVIFGQETEQFSKERGMAYNVGESVALLAEMAAEFGLNPASGVTRAAVANSVKAFGKAVAKKTLTRPGTLAKLRAVGAAGTAKAFAPAVGAALGEGAAIAGTTQLPKNYAEMQTRMNGHAERTVSGGYAFKESAGAGEAFAKSFGRAAGSNAIFLPSLGIKGFGGTMEKAADKLFGESGAKVAGEIASVFKFPGKVLPMSNLPEAALKMKTSELLSVMSGDESIADWADPERNLETLAVLLAAEFMMGAPRKVAQGREYYNVAKAKARAAQSYADAMSIFAKSGKAEIFNDFHSRLHTVESPEEAIAALYNGREHLSEPEVKALYDMVGAMFRYKGASDYYNARYDAGRKGKDATPNDTEGAPSDSAEPIGENRRLRGSKENPADDMRATVDEVRTDSFAEGYAAEDNVSRRDMRSIYEARREALSSQIGSKLVEMIDSLGDEFDISTVDEQQRHSVIDYISARSAWEGVDERLNEEGQERISEAEALIDSRTNQSDGMIQEVKLRNDDSFWWLRNGTISVLDNGEIDRSTSSDMVFLVNANGEVKSFALSDIAELGERVSPGVLKAQAREVEESRKAAMGIKDVAEGADNGRDSVTLQHGDADTYGSRPEQNSGGLDLREDGGGMAADNAGGVASTADRGDIRVFEPEVAASRGEHPDGSERNRREAESQRLVEIAKGNGLFIPSDGWENLGKRQPGRTGESVVYYNDVEGRYYKVKDPYAKSPIKSGVQPEDAIYEHLLHNMYFPETAYRFEGIGEVIGDVRIILSQGKVVAIGQASKEQVEAALAEKGLVPEGKYTYGNDDISVTDVMGENALLGADGKVYFIDPIINVKRPLRDILDGQKTPSAMDRVPKDEAGKPMFTDADPEIAWDAIAEAFPTEASAQEWVGKQLAKAKGALSQLEKGRYDVPDDFAEAARAAQERASQITAAKEYASRWEAISSVQKNRMAKAAEEAAAVRRAKEAEAEARRKAERDAASLAKQEAEAAKEAEKEWKRQKNALDKRLRDTAEEYKDVPGIMDILGNTDPQTLDEMAAWLLANNRITLSDKKTSLGVRTSAGARTFAGIGNYESKKLFGQFASAENGGVSIETLAEDIGKQFCDQFGIPYDNLALRDAIAERLSGSNTRGDIFNYIVERRIQQARELGEYYRQQEDLAYAEWCEENYHMSPEDYESYEELLLEEAIARQSIDFEALDSKIVEERLREQARIADYESVRMEEAKEALENLDESKLNSNIADESTQQKHGLVRTLGKDPTGADGNSSGGSEILSSPRTVSPEGDSSMEERRSGIYARYGDEGTNKEGSIPESTSGNGREGVEEPGDGYLHTLFGDEGGGVQRGLFDDINKKPEELVPIGHGVFGKIYDQFKGKVKEAVAFLAKNKEGDLLGVFNRKDFGVVDLVWGGNNGGWSHILSKHVGDGRSFATPEEAAKAIDEIITVGEKVFENGDKVVFRIGNKLVTVRKNLRERGKKIADKNWVLTAYDESAADNGGSAITNVNQAKAAPSTALSDDKSSNSTAEMQGGEAKSEKSEDTRDKISQAEAQVETNPTEAQKEAGNYRKGHVTVDGHNITIEQPKGSVRRGKDANGKEWETTMNNIYGYIRGTKGVDGDHIDVFLSDDPERGDVFVVDQYNPDGSFDEHKVMYGFGNDAEALSAYLSNYEKGWEHGRRIDITGVSKDDFRKWIDSSTRKTKPFAEYKGMKLIESGIANKFEYFGGTLGELIDKAKTQATGLIKKIISPVSNRLRSDLAKKGVEIDDGYKHVIDNNAIRHALKKHGSKKELERGQMPITEKDFERIEDVVSNYDKLDTEIGKRGNDVILYSKSYPDGTTIFVEEKRSGRKELAAVTIYKRNNSTLIGANRNEATQIPNSGEVVDKGSEILSVKQANDVKTLRKIDDFGEKIEGARKDALSRIAKTLDNVTAKALVELPLGKAVSRPDFGKSIARGEMDERDAMAAEALWQTVYGERKPGNSRKNKFKIAQWGEQTAGKIDKLREFLGADSDKRVKMIEQMKQFSFPNETAEREDYERIVGYNPDKKLLEPVFTPAPEAVALAVMEQIGMRPGDKRKIEFQIQTDLTHQYYELRSASGDRVHGFNRVRSLNEAIDNMATAVRIANKDLDVVYPASCFRVVGVDPVMTSTGKFSVSWIKGRYGYDERQFDNIQEAEAFMSSKKEAGIPASMRELKTRTGEYGSYKIAFTNPVTDEGMEVRNSLGDRNEALMAISEGVEALSEIVNGNYAKKLDNKEVSKPSHFFVTTIYNRSGKHFVVARNGYGTIKLGDFKNPAVKEFDTLKEAEAWFSENSGALEQAYAADLKKRREFVFFKPSKEPRRGVDRRGNRDVTPDEFGDMFGFRGVQFGNWTKDADRQMALNEAYDAFLDMADVLGMSPRAMSLNGELGIAFGARGMGGANAHYEPVEVVINLTKTRGAGSLAHEWWHAFDNYMMRRGGNPLLYATEAMTMHGARKEVSEAFRELSKAINESKYHARSMLRGTDYWGSAREESARLFGEWIVSKLAEKNGANHFLSRGVEPSTMEDYKQLIYWSYKENEMLAGRDPQPYKEWIETTESDPLGDYPYPTSEELAELGKPLQKLFDVLEERGNTGEVMEPEAAYQMSLFDRTEKPVGAMQRSLFDDVEQQVSRLPEEEGKRLQKAAEIMNEEIDRYNDAYNLYLEQSSPVERLLDSYDGDESGRRELQAELDSYGDRFNERQAETARALTSYFRQLGNTPKDAERMSHDKLAQFRADVEMRRRMLNFRGEVPESQDADLQQPHGMPDDSHVERQEMKTAGNELIQFNSFGRLPRVEQGEFCTVERQFTTTGEFSFTGNDRIDSVDDAAYVFRSLESYAVENTFAMLVKDGRPMIMHLGMGHATASVVDCTAIRAGMDAYGADDIYFVHNHPSGNLRCSIPDTNILKALNGIVDGKAKVHAIIMDTTSGKYGTFDLDASQEEHLRPTSGGDAAVATYRFDRLDPKKGAPDLGRVRTPDDVTRILTDLRLGSGDKVGVLVLDQSNRVVGNFLTPYADLRRSRELADEATGYAAKHGGTGVILYGNSIDFSAIKDVNAAVTSRSGGHVRMLDVVSIDNGLNRSAQNSGMMQEPRANYGAYVNDGGMKRSATAEAEWRKRMVDERGIVMPGLADKSVNVVEVPRHDFTGEKPISQAREWARKNIVGEHELTDGDGKNVKYTISGKAVDKYLSQSAIGKSENLGVHLSVLKKLPEVIGESIEVEVHPDYKKGEDGVRKPENGANRDNVIHRYYGVANINGGVHRVKTTIVEPNEDKSQLKPHSYEVTKIELLPEDNSSTLEPTTHLKVKTSVGVANLSNDFEKSNDNGAKNELSPTRNENTAEKRVFSRNGDSSKIGAQESAQAQPIQSLEIAKLESLISGSETSNALSNSNDGLKKRTILSAAKLLNGVEKSYDKGVKILDASKKEEERFRNLYDMSDMELPEVHDDSQVMYGMEEAVTNSMLRLAEKQSESWKARSDAYRRIGGNLSSILQGMSVQKEYDKQTVKRVTDLAQSMLQNGQMTGLRDGEVKRLLSAVKNANGRKDVRKQVEGIVDIMLASQLRNQEATLDRLLSTRGKKLSPKGIEVAGRLDPGAIAQIATFRRMRMADEATIKDKISGVSKDMASGDAKIAERAALEYDALHMALDYRTSIVDRKNEISNLGHSMKKSYAEMQRGEISRQTYNEFVQSCQNTKRGLRAKMIESYSSLISAMSGTIDSGRARARELANQDKERVRHIYHMIEADMGWISSNSHKDGLTKMQKATNSAVLQGLTITLPTFNEILKTFCPWAPGGEGRIYRYFMDKWVLSTENDYIGKKKAFDTLKEKGAEILGISGDKWETIGLKARDMNFTNGERNITVEWVDAEGRRKFELGVLQAAYAYAANKMEDGRMKLDKMGLGDAEMKDLTKLLPKEIRDLVDWLQDEFLPSLREKYNAVHLRLFGTEMEKIDNYFPLKIHKGDVHRDVDLANPNAEDYQSSVTTGAIIKRKRNTCSLELLNSDIFNVITEHVNDMEHWAAYSELGKDLNTLLSINEFRAKVENMTTIFGSGPALWEKFSRCCQMATGDYIPEGGKVGDKEFLNLVKLGTTAKVAFMPWTAVKQTLSYPAIFMSASLPEIVYSMRHPAEAFNWCLDNLPLFHKRWVGRMAGNEKLLPTELDASFWHRSIVEKLSGIGMTPNAFVDALTISQIAYSTYRTKYKRYLDWGYTTEQAHKKACIDATIAYNETQQSGEAAFLSEFQVSRTWLSVLLTAFRNSSIGYQRKLLSATRDIYNAVTIKGELRQRYMRDKMIEDGLSEKNAEKAARHISSRAMLDAIMKAAATGLLSLLWNIGSHSPYSLVGSDSEEKKEMLKNDVARSVFDFLFQGLAGGDVISAGLTALVTRGDISEYDIEKDMPAISDLDKVMKQFDYDTVGAWNSLFNLAVQTTVGFNPQVISNWIGAIWDYCGQDAQTSQEFTILMLRILQAPQSQIDKIYFDELNLSGEQAKKCTPMEIAHRYAEYKVRTGSNILFYGMGFTSDETDRDRIKRYEKRAMKVLKSQINGLYPPEVNAAYDKFKAAHDRIRDQKLGVAKKHDAREITTAQMLSEIDRSVVEDPDYEVFVSFSEMDRRLNKMASGLIDSRSPEEANSYCEALRHLKTCMADWYNSDDQTERDSIMGDGLDYADDFLERMKEEWESELDAVNE